MVSLFHRHPRGVNFKKAGTKLNFNFNSMWIKKWATCCTLRLRITITTPIIATPRWAAYDREKQTTMNWTCWTNKVWTIFYQSMFYSSVWQTTEQTEVIEKFQRQNDRTNKLWRVCVILLNSLLIIYYNSGFLFLRSLSSVLSKSMLLCFLSLFLRTQCFPLLSPPL